MAFVNIVKFGVSSPADTTPLHALGRAGYEAADILGVIGKSEGNGCVNDFSRTLSTTVWEPLIPASAVTIFSGGTEGVLSPHVTFIVRNSAPTGLRCAVGRTREFQPYEIGTATQAREVSASIQAILQASDILPDQVQMVLIKCPLLTSAKIQAIEAASRAPVTTDTYTSMAKSRYASAIGIAVALGEVPEEDLDKSVMNEASWSTKASCSSGAELDDCHILILASQPGSEGNLRAVCSYMEDAIDATAILKSLEQVKADDGEVLQVFAKAEADPRGSIRGKRHTMSTDSDIHSTRHARAAVGGLIAGLVGDSQIYVSGGAEGQGPAGGGPLCIVYQVSGVPR